MTEITCTDFRIVFLLFISHLPCFRAESEIQMLEMSHPKDMRVGQSFAKQTSNFPKMNVEMVIEGSVRYDNDRVMITAQLIDGQSGIHMWSEEYQRDLTDVFAVQAEIATAISNALEAGLLDTEIEQIGKPPTSSPETYALYLKALSSHSADFPLLDEAIQIDPDFALAYAYKSYTMSASLRFLSPQSEFASAWRGWEDIAIESATKALELDDNLALAHTSLALIDEVNWRRTDAQRRFDRAIALNPNNVDSPIAYATFKRVTGDVSEAIEIHGRTLELDPNSLMNRHQLGVAHMFAQDHVAALETF